MPHTLLSPHGSCPARGKGATPLPLPPEEGWSSLSTGWQHTIPLLFMFAMGKLEEGDGPPT